MVSRIYPERLRPKGPKVTRAQLREAFLEAIAPAFSACAKDLILAEKTHKKAMAQAWVDYYAAIGPARKDYQEAMDRLEGRE